MWGFWSKGGSVVVQSDCIRHSRFAGIVIVILLSVLCGSAPALARDQTLVFLANEKLTPIAYAQNGIAKGVVVDIAKALGEKIGRPVEMMTMDWEKAQAQVADGQADALLQINCTPGREEIYSFSEPLLPSEFVIIKRQDSMDIHGSEDLVGKRVGVEIGGYPYDLLSGNGDIDRVAILSPAQGIEFLKSKELDALVMDRWIGEYALAQAGASGLLIAREPFAVNQSHIAVKKGNDQLLELINQGLQEIKSDGTLDRILQNWRGKNVIYVTAERMTRVAVTASLAILLVISSISIFFVVKLRKLNQALEVKVAERTQELALANRRLQTANGVLKKESMLDQLTQILNRRGFDAIYEEAWASCQRLQQPLALIMLDLDHFKAVNDEFGHLIGDQYLRQFALLLQSQAQSDHVEVARLGGDEFVCVLQNTTEEGAAGFAEAIRAKIDGLALTHGGAEITLSASFGVAALIPKPDLKSNDLIALADQALYQAKGDGKNRVMRALAGGQWEM